MKLKALQLDAMERVPGIFGWTEVRLPAVL
jgi:hypothetical protein